MIRRQPPKSDERPNPDAGNTRLSEPGAASSERYDDFIAESSQALFDLRETVISSLFGAELLHWLPTRFEWVRSGAKRFGLPRDEVLGDLMEACRSRWDTPQKRRLLPLVRYLGSRWPLLGLSFLRFALALVSARWAAKTFRPALHGSGAEVPTWDKAPKVSVVILSFNRASYLKRTIRAFLETVDYPSYELIVVDNGSEDGSVQFLEDARSRGAISKLLLLGNNHGISAGYNHGFAVADPDTDFYMKLDSDIEVLSRGWLGEVIRFMTAHERVGLVALNQVNHPALTLIPTEILGDTELMSFGEFPCGSAMVIPRRVRQEIGCFVEHPSMTYVLDDVDFYQRVSRSGYSAYFMKNLLALHQLSKDWTKYIRRNQDYRRAMDFSVQLAREYDAGDRPIEVFYEEYEG